ncbi:hypothetical protein A1O1_04182 [Capronia coronata CBS 617.96]|uniref:RTA1 like protein n=1 Tax=Capronia coronata CBS 617.96 TaxID=1182541 RepID=W9YN21_9EURO|nr:uncharacterized protein A1O1_04182 [Capronia coronata CBS 617.96]EXJ91075.1 hypothetical protein A1O1_04182 [Capronia coronata CBS 617.96]
MAGQESHYDYVPSLAAAVIFVVVFALLSLYHLYLLVEKRVWFCVPLLVGGVFEVVGFTGRAVGHSDGTSLPPYILQALLILLAPILFAASTYMLLGRIMRQTGAESYSVIRVNWLTKVFVVGDIFCFLAQALGGGMLAGADTAEDSSRGEKVILFGLVLQIVIFGGFLVVALLFHQRLRRKPTDLAVSGGVPWQRLMVTMYGVSGFITLRNLFRVIEYALGDDGYLLTNEWPIYILDALPMAAVLGITVFWYQCDIGKANSGISLQRVSV